MEDSELRKRVSNIFNIDPTTIPATACWLDHGKCPYGEPRGRFTERPIAFCVKGNNKSNGCKKLRENVPEISDVINAEEIRQYILDKGEQEGRDSERKEMVRELNVASGRLSEILRKQADWWGPGVFQKLILLVSDIIKEKEDANIKVVNISDVNSLE